VTVRPFAFTLGARYDYMDYRDYHAVSPRALAEYLASPAVTLSAAWGLYHQPPDAQEWDDMQGNPDLRAERTFHYNTGLRWDIDPETRLVAEAYCKDMYDRIVDRNVTTTETVEITPGYTTNVPVTHVVKRNLGRGRAFGIELLLKRRETPDRRLYGWASLAVSRAERKDTTDARGRWYPYDADETFALSLVARYRATRRFNFGARFRADSGKPYTEVARAAWDPEDEHYRLVERAAKNGARLPFYSALDIRTEWVFPGMFGLEKGIVYVDVLNLYNIGISDSSGKTIVETRNVTGKQFDRSTGKMLPTYDLPIVPLLGFEARW
jgi:outer membrane receptor protein involved in Fe transport